MVLAINWDQGGAAPLCCFSNWIVKSFKIQEDFLEQAPVVPGGLSKLMLWALNPTESLFSWEVYKLKEGGW